VRNGEKSGRVPLPLWRNLLPPSSEWKSAATILEEAAVSIFKVEVKNIP
jgi:hypothetical protein